MTYMCPTVSAVTVTECHALHTHVTRMSLIWPYNGLTTSSVTQCYGIWRWSCDSHVTYTHSELCCRNLQCRKNGRHNNQRYSHSSHCCRNQHMGHRAQGLEKMHVMKRNTNEQLKTTYCILQQLMHQPFSLQSSIDQLLYRVVFTLTKNLELH